MSDSERRIQRLETQVAKLQLAIDRLLPSRGREATIHGKRGGALFLYTLTADMTEIAPGSGGSATADLQPLPSGSTISGATVYDRVETAAHQVTGDQGLCIKAGDKYYVVEPACDFGGYTPEPI